MYSSYTRRSVRQTPINLLPPQQRMRQKTRQEIIQDKQQPKVQVIKFQDQKAKPDPQLRQSMRQSLRQSMRQQSYNQRGYYGYGGQQRNYRGFGRGSAYGYGQQRETDVQHINRQVFFKNLPQLHITKPLTNKELKRKAVLQRQTTIEPEPDYEMIAEQRRAQENAMKQQLNQLQNTQKQLQLQRQNSNLSNSLRQSFTEQNIRTSLQRSGSIRNNQAVFNLRSGYVARPPKYALLNVHAGNQSKQNTLGISQSTSQLGYPGQRTNMFSQNFGLRKSRDFAQQQLRKRYNTKKQNDDGEVKEIKYSDKPVSSFIPVKKVTLSVPNHDKGGSKPKKQQSEVHEIQQETQEISDKIKTVEKDLENIQSKQKSHNKNQSQKHQNKGGQQKYQGGKINGKRHGYGTLSTLEGSLIYKGTWNYGIYDGNGQQINQDKSCISEQFSYQNLRDLRNDWMNYQGCFEKGQWSGYGIITFKNGDKWKGIFKNGLLNGFGIYEFAGEGTVIGKWKDGTFSGSL